ncbi:cadmium resistance transporter [Aetokthonos hydrillicola Thurmond2011]|jgi:cadmium resistance transport/sequestration family protein|uniref:Cadmium resistance transporter n=1 Tax=Aetokthonos hydrillicola Thurmond2011 TaxID=2712845 RepID=A0AAP5ID91_9CYAN|nr:cadmium resistance transporter [Aetokthonos hydrillicola]MBO3459744.1 transporter [Aetokthonos hydrillicola CCALA 1050]MBW4585176.1 cadmium resistance transporter [Aetokthonos hydrillicola CCALA 1050]MDR9899515.1 cadmium resistance transporter [Aetokthonos hydrillicola Thurmond2011]
MDRLATALIEGVIAFIATNTDDLLLLLLFFSQVDTNFRRRHIVTGQYLGFIIILIASLPGFFGGLVVRREYMGLLGLLPIGIGLLQLIKRQQEGIEVQTVTTELREPLHNNRILSFILSILSPQTYKVAAVTFANGGDNISIYVPLFAGQTLTSLGIILSIFFILLGLWCLIAYLLARQPNIASIFNRYGKRLVPFLLIALGLFIMYERDTFSLFKF